MHRSEPSLDALTTELRISNSSPFPWIIVAALVVGLAASVAVGWVKLTPPATPQERRANAIAELAAGQKEFQEFAATARAQAAWESASAGLAALQETQAATLEAAKELEELFVSLGESDDGRRIAAAPALVAQFVALRDRKRLTTQELEVLGQSLRKLKQVSDRALADETLLIDVDGEILAIIRDIEGQLTQLTEVRHDLASLRLLREQAEGNAPANASLAQAVVTWQRERSEAHLEDLAQAQAQLQSEMAQRRQIETLEAARRQEEAKLVAEAADNSVRAMLAAGRSKKEQAIVRKAQAELAAVRARYELEREFHEELPEIRSLLAPVISKGKMQLGGQPFAWAPGEEGPLSLSQIVRFGALKPNQEMLLATLFCGPTTGNDRPFGGFPERIPYNGGRFKRAQDLLIKYGELMVEKKLLNP